jgi:DNA-binding MarR family transcriptional regulator
MQRLLLDRFIPFRLSVLSNKVSGAIARHYSERFGLSIHEWRVMAVLGETPGLSAREVAERTAMDKVQVSRAVASLVDAKRVARTPDDEDGRIGHLELTRGGRTIYGRIAPLALGLEKTFLAALTRDERAALDKLLVKLTKQAQALDGESRTAA